MDVTQEISPGKWYSSPTQNSVLVSPPQESHHYDPVARYVMDLMGASKSNRQTYDSYWDYYYRLYRNQQWPNRRALRGADWRAYLVINYIFAIIDSIKAVLLDSKPRIVIGARYPAQRDRAQTLQYGLDAVWSRARVTRRTADAWLNALIYGTGYIKLWWDPDLCDINCKVVPSEHIYADPEASGISDCEFICEASPVSMSYVRRHYGPIARYVRPDAGFQGSFSQHKSEGVIASGYNPNTPFRWVSPVGDNPLVADQTEFSNAPFKPSYTRQDMVTLVECWVKDYSYIEEDVLIQYFDPIAQQYTTTTHHVRKRAFPNGRVIHMAGGVVLSDEACPYKKWPYVRFVDNALPGEFYGMGECEILKDLQLELNKRRSQMVDHAALMGNAVWIISKDSDVDDDMISNKPGMIIFKNAGSEVRREPPPQMPNWIMQSIELTVRDMREVSGVSGIPGGQPPKGVRSGSGFQAANNIATIRIRAKGHNLEDAIEDAGAIIVSLMQQFYTPARFIKITGASNQVYFIPWDGRAMQGDWDINIETGSTMSITKEAQGQQAIEMFKLKAIDNRALLERTNFPDAENILRRMGDQTVQTENPHYPGYPGPPNPDRTDTSGYSATVRHAVPSPAPGPMGGLVPQGEGGGGGQGPKPPPPPKPQQSSPTMGSSAPKGGGRGR